MLSNNDIKLVYPTGWSSTSNLTSPIGGPPQTGAFVSTSSTGMFPTGTSAVAGSITNYRYSKVFFLHTGQSGVTNNLSDPFVYITNETVYNQIALAPDPYFLGIHSAQTGFASNRTSIPHGLSAVYFTGYTAENPLRFTNVMLVTGGSIGIWVRQGIQPGLVTSYNNSFQLALNGNIT